MWFIGFGMVVVVEIKVGFFKFSLVARIIFDKILREELDLTVCFVRFG